MENQTRWFVYDEGLKVWIDGKLVATIKPDQFKFMMVQLAKHIAKNDGS